MRGTYLDLLAKYGISGAHPGGLHLTKRILNTLNFDINTRLLDLGCGTGQTLAYIAKTYPCKITGVDINNQMLNRAAFRFKTENLPVELYCANVMDLPFPGDSFDIALSESVTIFTKIDKALKEYERVLKSEGTLLAIEMSAEYPLSSREVEEIKSVYGIEYVPTVKEWEELFRTAGFKGIQTNSEAIYPTLTFTSPKMLYDFYPHLRTISRYRKILGYRVYHCKK
ncbi:MAG: methyltransferase domain-containing protein [Bacillota bacterium]|nr:methyltransferase domain-containing protein [Bacillota bacterium]